MCYNEVMIINLNNDRQTRALLGLDKDKFLELLEAFRKIFEQRQQEEYEEGKKKGSRQRKPGGGRKGKLPTYADKLFFVLFYLKNYPTFDVLGAIFNMGRSKACENLHKLLPILQATLKHLGVLPDREYSSPEELRKAMEEVEQVLIDATERLHNRPKDNEKQKEFYSGKKKAHTVKNTIFSTVDRVLLYVGRTFTGKNHDYGMFKQEFNKNEPWLEKIKAGLDLGYKGIEKDYPGGEIGIPHKKSRKSKNNPNPQLTEKEKAENRALSRVRIKVEHAIGGIKRYRILVHKFRNRVEGMFDDVIGICAGLWNFFIL